MKTLFLSGGERELVLQKLIEEKFNIIGVIVPTLTKTNARFLGVVKTALAHNIPVFSVNKENIESTISKLDFDVLLSCGFTFILNNDVIKRAGKIAINVHPTLLPTYRGFRSGPFILMNDEEYSGITVHQLTEEMDNGPIICQEKFAITKFDTTKSVFRKARELEPDVVLKAMRSILNNSFKLTPQNESLATTFNKVRTPEDSIINWDKPLKELYNEIRACDSEDYPAYFIINNERVFIKLWRKNKSDSESDMI